VAGIVVAIMAAGLWWLVRQGEGTPAAGERADVGSPPVTSTSFTPRSIGDPIRGEERPHIAHVAIADLDRDGLPDVLVCDAIRNQLTWIRQAPRGRYTERVIADVPAPAHVEVVDFEEDGDLDLVVASLGALFPNNNRIGAVIVYENDGKQGFAARYIADRVARVADARTGDLDGDGDLDVAVAGFGFDDGETSWLENTGNWTFEQHVLQRLSGPINSLVMDLNGDAALDIVALVSQEWEEIWGFLNDGRGGFTARLLWGSTNTDFGSSWLTSIDMDRDGDPDLLYANGDAFEYAPPNSRPWQGLQWLENRGNLQFELHRIVDLQGAMSPDAFDLDGDGDLDIVLVTSNNDWDNPQAPSLVWLENDGRMQFSMHPIAISPTHLLPLATGDLDGDGRRDLVTGGMHISRPYDRMARITAWSNIRGASPP
jgi:hypothetical protein